MTPFPPPFAPVISPYSSSFRYSGFIHIISYESNLVWEFPFVQQIMDNLRVKSWNACFQRTNSRIATLWNATAKRFRSTWISRTNSRLILRLLVHIILLQMTYYMPIWAYNKVYWQFADIVNNSPIMSSFLWAKTYLSKVKKLRLLMVILSMPVRVIPVHNFPWLNISW